MRCPCRKKSETRAYADCCEPYHAGLRPAPTAEALMRSRYAAFALEKADYILATWHPSTRPCEMTFRTGQVWQMLRVITAKSEGDTATVEFLARASNAGARQDVHEISRFVREDGRWYYVADAAQSPVTQGT